MITDTNTITREEIAAKIYVSLSLDDFDDFDDAADYALDAADAFIRRLYGNSATRSTTEVGSDDSKRKTKFSLF